MRHKIRHFDHIAAYYSYLASIDTTMFGRFNMVDKAGWYRFASR